MTAVMTEGQATVLSLPKKRRAKVAKKQRRMIPHPNGSTVILTKHAAEWVRKALAPFEAAAREQYGVNEEGRHGGLPKGLQDLCNAARSYFPGVEPETIPRRLYRILTEEYVSIDANIVEAFLLGGGIFIHETDLLQLPAGLEAAKERIDVYCDLHGELPEETKADLAADLYEFSLLCICGSEEFWAAKEEARLAVRAAEDAEVAA